jgi:hypothetical protein
MLIATLQVTANWLNALLVQETLGYEHIPVFQLLLLFCSMLRLVWLTCLLQPIEAIGASTTASFLFAEVILQLISSYYMVITVMYGLDHNFYLGVMEIAEKGNLAMAMYTGALILKNMASCRM